MLSFIDLRNWPVAARLKNDSGTLVLASVGYGKLSDMYTIRDLV